MKVYVIRNEKDDRFYVGMRMNPADRLLEHNRGGVRSTKAYRPWLLIDDETYPNRQEARKREKYLKSGYGKQWLKQKYKLVL